jgi:glycosyltransferase involved in cell wall biosynthesis
MAEASPSAAPRRVSFIVPAFDEERRLGSSLDSLIAYCAQQPYESEIIVVDDGSADATRAVAERAQERLPERASLRILKHDHNRGKGAAVRTGMLASTGEYVLYLDADLATPPEETSRLLDALDEGIDVAIGVRIQPGGYDMRASEPAFRRIGGYIFTAVRRRLLLSDVYDTQCGFKAFRKEAAGRIFRLQELDGWAFDAELLFIAQRLGYSIRQIPVEWHHVEGSRFQIGIRSAIRELRDLARIRWVHRSLRRDT